MRKFKRAAVAAVGLLAFSGFAAQSAQAADVSAQAGGYANGKYGSFSSCQSSGNNNDIIEEFHCIDNGDGSWTLWVDRDHCGAAVANGTAAQASTKDGLSTMGC